MADGTAAKADDVLAWRTITRSYDDATDTLTVVETQDIEPVLIENTMLQNSWDGFSPDREMQAIWNIPTIVIDKWLLEEGINFFNPDHADAIRRKMKDPQYRKFVCYKPGHPNIIIKGVR